MSNTEEAVIQAKGVQIGGSEDDLLPILFRAAVDEGEISAIVLATEDNAVNIRRTMLKQKLLCDTG